MPDYIANPADALPETSIARWDANIAALRVLKQMEAEGRTATPSEQAILAHYSGFGDTSFEPGFVSYTREPAWQRRKDELRELVTEDEYRSIERSRLNAFYTSPEVIESTWDGLRDLGADRADNLKVLEPSAGSGRFLAYQPRAWHRSPHGRRSSWTPHRPG